MNVISAKSEYLTPDPMTLEKYLMSPGMPTLVDDERQFEAAVFSVLNLKAAELEKDLEQALIQATRSGIPILHIDTWEFMAGHTTRRVVEPLAVFARKNWRKWRMVWGLAVKLDLVAYAPWWLSLLGWFV